MDDKLAPLGLTAQHLKKLVIEAVTSMRHGRFDKLNRTIANLAAAKFKFRIFRGDRPRMR